MRHLGRRLWQAGCLCGWLGTMLLAPAQSEAADLNYIETSRPELLNPVDGSRNVIGIRSLELMYRGLIGQDEFGEWIPDLALTLPSFDEEKSELVFRLREGLKWPDEEKITAADVVHSYYIYRDRRSRYGNADLLAVFDSVYAEDETTIRFHLAQAHPHALARAGYPVMPKHLVGDDTYLPPNSAFNTQPVGAGPYVLAYAEDNLLSFETNPWYHKSRPNIETVDLVVSPDENTQHQLLMAGGYVHLDPVVRPQDLPALYASAEHDVRPYSSQTWYGFAYNTKRGLLRFREVRQAFSIAYNQAGALDSYFANQGNLVSGPYTKASFCYNREVPQYPFDVERAIRMLDEASILDRNSDGIREYEGEDVKLVMVLSKDMSQANRDVCADFAQQLSKSLRIDVQLDYVDQRVWYERIFIDRDFDITFMSWKFDDASNIYPLFSKTQTDPGEYNVCQFENDEVQTQLEIFTTTTDDAERTAAGQRLHQLLFDESPYTFLWTVEHSSAYLRSHLKRIRIQPFYFFSYIDEWELE